MGQRVREMDDGELRRILSDKLEREESMVRLRRRLHAAEASCAAPPARDGLGQSGRLP